MNRRLREKLYDFVYEHSFQGVSVQAIENNFPYNSLSVQAELKDLTDNGAIYLAGADPEPFYRATWYSEQDQISRCPDCDSLYHQTCVEED